MSETLNLKLISEKSTYISEALKTLRTNILFCGSDVKCISLTSCIPNEGKSVVSLELAASLSKIEKRVLFIDADMRKSVLKQRSKLPTVAGLSQYLTKQASLEEVICQTQFPNLDVIMCGFYPPNPVELLSGEFFKEFLSSMRERYDYIIIDTPPLGAVIDSAIISTICDGTIMVIAKDKVSYRFAQSVRDQLLKANCKILGVILNFYQNNSYSNSKYRYRYGNKENMQYYT